MHDLITPALLLIALGVLLALVHPVHRCPRCRGRRVITYGRGVRPCPRCKATGRARRLGAVLIHRFIQDARRESNR